MGSLLDSRIGIWASVIVLAVGSAVAASTGPFGTLTWEAPVAAFVSIVVVTGLCALAAGIVIVTGWRRRLAEVTILGAALAAGSILPMVHGLTIPGVMYGPNNAVSLAAFCAVPLALVVATPILAPPSALTFAVARRWRVWAVAWTGMTCAAAIGLLVSPDALPAPRPGTPTAIAVVVLSLAGTLSISWRHLRLYRIGRRRASLVASVGFAYLGLSTLTWLGAGPFSPAWWLAHVLDGAGVLTATLGLWLAHRRDLDVVARLSPVINRDPLVALELGLTPVVHDYIAALAEKDEGTRDHVVRVADLAMRCGARAGLDERRLRLLGLGALLHDIGKLEAPTDVLLKPGALTDAEFDLMKQHTLWGERLMLSAPVLAPAAPLVRWHHERADGAGYPDGIAGDAIPFEVTIISVCDAWDAMTWTRPYRQGMTHEAATAVLEAHSGTQWAARSVDLVLREITVGGIPDRPVFDGVGRSRSGGTSGQLCNCDDALPGMAVRPGARTNREPARASHTYAPDGANGNGRARHPSGSVV